MCLKIAPMWAAAPNLSVTDNVIMKNYRKPPISKGRLLDMNAATNFAKELKQAYDIIVPTVNTPGATAFGRKSAACDPGA